MANGVALDWENDYHLALNLVANSKGYCYLIIAGWAFHAESLNRRLFKAKASLSVAGDLVHFFLHEQNIDSGRDVPGIVTYTSRCWQKFEYLLFGKMESNGDYERLGWDFKTTSAYMQGNTNKDAIIFKGNGKIDTWRPLHLQWTEIRVG